MASLGLVACGPVTGSATGAAGGSGHPSPSAPPTKALATRWSAAVAQLGYVVPAGNLLLLSTSTGLKALNEAGQPAWQLAPMGGSQNRILYPIVVGSTAYVLEDTGHEPVLVGPLSIPADTATVIAVDLASGTPTVAASTAWGNNNHSSSSAGLPVAASQTTLVFASGYHQLPVFYSIAQKTVATITDRDASGCGDATFAPFPPFSAAARGSVNPSSLPAGEPSGWLLCLEKSATTAYLVDHKFSLDHTAQLPDPVTSSGELVCGQNTCVSNFQPAVILDRTTLKQIGQPIATAGELGYASEIGKDNWVLFHPVDQSVHGFAANGTPWSASITVPDGGVASVPGASPPVFGLPTTDQTKISWIDASTGKVATQTPLPKQPVVMSLDDGTVAVNSPQGFEVLSPSSVVARGPAISGADDSSHFQAYKLPNGSYLVLAGSSDSETATLLVAS